MSQSGHTLSYDIVYELSRKMAIKWLNMWVFPTFLAFQVLMSVLCLSLNKVIPLNQPASSSLIWRTIKLIAYDSPTLTSRHLFHPEQNYSLESVHSP